MAKLSKEKQNDLIKVEIKRLEDIFADLPEDRQSAAKRLIERVAFMTITLEILEDAIKTKGPTYLFTQGSQRMIVENPAQKSYNSMINRYTAAYDKLFGLLAKPKDGGGNGEGDDGFDTFVNDR